MYQHLLTPSVPAQLDYLEVFFSLCEILLQLYARFSNESEGAFNGHVFDGLVKVDTAVKKHLLDPVTTEVTDMAGEVLNEQLAGFLAPA